MSGASIRAEDEGPKFSQRVRLKVGWKWNS